MDFGQSEEQEALVGLAAQIFEGQCSLERLSEVEAGAERFDRDLWHELARADLIGMALPESAGGGGFGFLELCLLLQEQGRAVASIPLAPALVAGMTVAHFGSETRQQALLPRLVSGESVLTIALAEPGTGPRTPALEAVPVGEGWVLQGAKTTVPFAHVAETMVVSARVEDGTALFVVPLDADGVSIERQDTFNHEPDFHVDFDAVAVDGDQRLGGGSDDPLGWLVDRMTVGLCAVAAGVADRGTRLTADYSTERQQFGRPIATFQAVGQRMADSYIDAEAIGLTMLSAATRLAVGEAADAEVAVAKYWASTAGSRVGHAGLHVHGGISIDLDYPIHRYFLWSKQLEFTLGAGTEQLARLGEQLAREPV